MHAQGYTVQDHLANRSAEVKATYAAIIEAAKKLGPVTEEAKKTSIHLVRRSAFAGVTTRTAVLILTLKADSAIESARVAKCEQASRRRWHCEIRLRGPEEVDRELLSWLAKSYGLAG